MESQVEGKVIVLYRLNLDFLTSNSDSDMRVKPLCQCLFAIIAIVLKDSSSSGREIHEDKNSRNIEIVKWLD